MKIIIIEDEDLSAKDLANTITTLYPDAEIVSILGSIKSCLRFFKQPANADLIFSDIELGDGLIFELFSRVEIDIPIIFCTAYDEYALNAFKANGIEYVLKPYTNNTISNALKKYLALRSMFESKGTNDYQILLKMLNDKKEVEQ
ncbi:MAG TPA: response regulator, partial [Arachidicoccus sp.]